METENVHFVTVINLQDKFFISQHWMADYQPAQSHATLPSSPLLSMSPIKTTSHAFFGLPTSLPLQLIQLALPNYSHTSSPHGRQSPNKI